MKYFIKVFSLALGSLAMDLVRLSAVLLAIAAVLWLAAEYPLMFFGAVGIIVFLIVLVLRACKIEEALSLKEHRKLYHNEE